MSEAEGKAASARRAGVARWLAAAAGPAGRRALWVALVVGTVLNLINQGDALWAHGEVSWTKVLLTYVVPFCVSLHGAVSSGNIEAKA